MTPTLIELKGVERHYVQGQRKLTVLNGADFALGKGETVALVAPSGAGKSTLLHLAGLLERPDAGDVILNGRACGRLSDDERTAIRRNDIGFVYQFHHLLPEFSALENIVIPQLVRGLTRKEAEARAAQLLDYMRSASAPSIARPSCRAASSSASRSRAPSPTRRWCCSPTSRPATSIRRPRSYVFEALEALVRQSGLSALIATHNHELAARMDRRVTLADGKVVEM